ncbi:unnamed protein product [Phyllotreta striolata]|uniref:Phosphotransferase n=1 Tax=Phyllotreta striolata TaxID=444603 RepID=A0A9N9TKL1_PHYSR|nr:unnamed protein product [Phyllotreta striolata]
MSAPTKSPPCKLPCDEPEPCEKFKKSCCSQKCNPVYLREMPARTVTKAKCSELVLTNQQLGQYMKNFLDAVRTGLKKANHQNAIVKCFPTYVQNLPTGQEEGKYLALDLGGTNFRVLMITLDPNAEEPEPDPDAEEEAEPEGGKLQVVSETYEIPEELMTGPGEDLFDFFAEKLSEFCGAQGVMEDELPLGFTFSFPLTQIGLKKGHLERWTKGFNCSGVIGQDVVKLLEQAIEKREDVKVKIVAVCNDTTGTLITCAYKDQTCKIGLIVGTGTNCCYVEKQDWVELFDAQDTGSGIVIINLESGAFGDDGALDFCRTKYDIDVDKDSINPGKQAHEKMISGMYLGELVRLAVVQLTEDGIMFNGKLTEEFKTKGSFETSFVSEIESDDPCKYDNAERICKELGVDWGTEEDYQDLRYVCCCFSRRAAFMVASSMAVLIRKMGYPMVTIGVDGSLFKLHPHFRNTCEHKLREILIPDSYKFQFMETADGSGIGAALIAAVSANDEEEGGDGDAEA